MKDDIDISELKRRALAIVEIYSDLNRTTEREADILHKAITMDRPQGEWVLVHPLQEDDEGAYMCSVCHSGDWRISTEFKFCPYCGAEMKEGDK